MQFLKVIWSTAVWCACMVGPGYVLLHFGPYWALGAALVTNFIWVALGDVGIGPAQSVERVGYTGIPRKLVFYASVVVAGIALYKLAIHLNVFIIRH